MHEIKYPIIRDFVYMNTHLLVTISVESKNCSYAMKRNNIRTLFNFTCKPRELGSKRFVTNFEFFKELPFFGKSKKLYIETFNRLVIIEKSEATYIIKVF